jgi:hypothetical protein
MNEIPAAAWKAYDQRTDLYLQLYLGILEAALQDFDQVYLAIDALDESQPRGQLLSLIGTLLTDDRFCKIQLLATSREYEDIRRGMHDICQPLSMSNLFVEADIRLYVAARIRENSQFRRWPTHLRTEVEDTLSAGAKGMFRWAVCQLDILRRLHHQSKIREALKSLPETLYETYERILSYIDVEERQLVRHALHWICFHGFLWKGEVPLPVRVLLKSYTIMSTRPQSQPDSGDLLCDLETLKDICGCLVSFTPVQQCEGNPDDQDEVNIAHYTVREFLESNQVSDSVTAWITISNQDCYSRILAAIFSYALSSEPESDDINNEGSSLPNTRLQIRGTSPLRDYCLASAVRSLTSTEEFVEPRLVFQFLDPRAPHYDELQGKLELHSRLQGELELHSRIEEGLLSNDVTIPFWYIRWTKSGELSSTCILVNLLVMECFSLAKDFCRTLNLREACPDFLRGEVIELVHWLGADDWDIRSRRFEGNLVEVLAQIRELRTEALDVLQETSTVISYKNLLPLFMPGIYEIMTEDEVGGGSGNEALQQLLLKGARPDPLGFRVMPLQIAVLMRNYYSVKILLEAGADPNNSGDPHGVAWDESSILYPYSKLHGVAPIDILRIFDPRPYFESGMGYNQITAMNGIITDKIYRILLSHGAKSGTRQGSEI